MIAVMMQLCEVDGPIAQAALRSFAAAIGQEAFDLFLIDDGSTSYWGNRIASLHREARLGQAYVVRLDRPTGVVNLVERQ
jgi:hypothetical protein